jgi:hypothetical protein
MANIFILFYGQNIRILSLLYVKLKNRKIFRVSRVSCNGEFIDATSVLWLLDRVSVDFAVHLSMARPTVVHVCDNSAI